MPAPAYQREQSKFAKWRMHVVEKRGTFITLAHKATPIITNIWREMTKRRGRGTSSATENKKNLHAKKRHISRG